MKIRNRLTMMSTLIFGVVFTIAGLIVYYSFYNSTQQVKFNELKNNCLLSAIYYLEKDELTSNEHQDIKNEFKDNIKGELVAIYNKDNQVSYGNLYEDQNITNYWLDRVRKQKSVSFSSHNYFYYGIYYPDNQGNFVVFVKSNNIEFKEQINRLLLIMSVVLIGGAICILLLSKLLSNVAYRPLSKVIADINSRDLSNFNEPIQIDKTNDEIEALIVTYNQLLARLSETFIIQKNFINYVSHELKTPLTAITGNLEVFAQRNRTPQEYQQMVIEAMSDVDKIEATISNLLVISGMKKDSLNQKIRIDELFWNVIDTLGQLGKHLNSQIIVDISVTDNEMLYINGNETLLQIALFNIVENAVKYSSGSEIYVKIEEDSNRLIIKIIDFGVGILPEDIPNVQTMFFRGKNIGDIKGSGVGMALAQTIFTQHQINMKIDSTVGHETTITLSF